MENPKIRFKGFTKDWEQRKLNEVAEKICVGFVGTCEKFYTDESGIPMYRTGNLNGLSLNRDDLKYVTNEFHQHNQKSQLKAGDILIARHGDSGKAVNYENSEEANCLNIVIIRPDFKKCNYKFLTNCINSPECQKHIKSLSAGSTQAVINTSEIEKLGVVIPANIDEQNRIARYFSTLDNLITLHQRKCEQTKKLKKYMLQKMFPRNGAKVPEIRFDGFTYDWEQRKFSELYARSSEKNDGSIGMDKNITVATMQFKNDVKVSTTEYLKTYYTFKLGDIAFEGHQSKEFRYGRFVENDIGNGIVSHIFAVFRPIQEYDLYFWKYAINNETLMQRILARSTKASTMMHDLVTNDFLNETFLVPSVKEQKQIGAFLNKLDNIITLHQRKCDELKKMKKYMLQNMFI